MKDSQDWLDDLFDDWLGKAKGFTPSDSSLSATLKTRHIVASDAKSAIRKHILQEALEIVDSVQAERVTGLDLVSKQELRNKFNDKYKED